MGRTAPTYRQALEERLKRWDSFGQLLTDPEDRAAFERIRRGTRRYIAQATYAGSPDLLESILLSALVDLARELPKRSGTGPPSAGTSPSPRGG
ncbi:MAG: hypothetical protein L3J95_02480 [Thermoplasmata archaeon]|nr:hypothetical protein [Thermoplasmata archaeon]MCI4359273.1 hypothetical protein [Thermoplasmata archaeon]